MSPASDPQHRPRSGRGRGPAPRLLLPSDRADLRVTWHPEADRFVLSLWHGDDCVASAPLPARDAAEVASFLVTHLGERGTWSPRVVGPDTPPPTLAPSTPPPAPRHLVRRVLGRVHRRAGDL